MQMLSPLSQPRRLWILLISINLYQVPLIWTVCGRNSRQHKTAASQCVGINWARGPPVPWLLRSVFVDFFFLSCSLPASAGAERCLSPYSACTANLQMKAVAGTSLIGENCSLEVRAAANK